MALPDMYGMGLQDPVETSLQDLEGHLQPADAALVATIRMAAELIDDLAADGQASKAMSYMYLVRDGMEKLGGSVASRKALGTEARKPKSKLAAVREIRGGENSSSKSRSRKAVGE